MRVVLSETHTLSAAILNLTKMNLAVAGSPHGVGVVDTDVLSLLDVHCRPDHHSGQQHGLNRFDEQDSVSTMQKNGWTIHSIFLVLSGLKKSFTLDVITKGQSTTISLCIGPFSAW